MPGTGGSAASDEDKKSSGDSQNAKMEVEPPKQHLPPDDVNSQSKSDKTGTHSCSIDLSNMATKADIMNMKNDIAAAVAAQINQNMVNTVNQEVHRAITPLSNNMTTRLDHQDNLIGVVYVRLDAMSKLIDQKKLMRNFKTTHQSNNRLINKFRTKSQLEINMSRAWERQCRNMKTGSMC